LCSSVSAGGTHQMAGACEQLALVLPGRPRLLAAHLLLLKPHILMRLQSDSCNCNCYFKMGHVCVCVGRFIEHKVLELSSLASLQLPSSISQEDVRPACLYICRHVHILSCCVNTLPCCISMIFWYIALLNMGITTLFKMKDLPLLIGKTFQ
jgi:hypothetical protein